MLVSCSKCALFIPDKIGDGSGIGTCQAYEQYKASGASSKALDKAFKALGDKVFWRGTLKDDKGDRYCTKHKPKI
jgi:hypothetical protein